MKTEKISQLAEKFYPQVVGLRHYFHQNPELAFEEYKTAAKVAETLQALGIEVQSQIAGTGVVGLIRGSNPGATVLLRADMDALKVTEAADVAYKSTVPGVMHACGHDGHTASLLGTAMILQALKDEIAGNIKLVFQPAEEGSGGALPMIEAGVLENPKVDAAFGCHLWGNLPEGKVELKSGPLMASPDSFTITIIGKGGHAALPHVSIDPVTIAAQVILQIQTLVARRIDPLVPAVISITTIHGGDTYNVIPNTVEMTGTIRLFDNALREWVPQAMESIIQHVTQANGASYTFQLFKKFPPLINDAAMTALAEASVTKIIGKDHVQQGTTPNMGGEDFAYFAAAVPSCFYFVGIVPPGEELVSHHNPKFQWDDRNLMISMQTLAQVALDYLDQESNRSK